MAPQPSKLYKINNNDANKSTGRGQNLVLAEAEEAPAREIRSGRRRQGSKWHKTAGRSQTQQTDLPNPYVASLYVRNRLRPCLISA